MKKPEIVSIEMLESRCQDLFDPHVPTLFFHGANIIWPNAPLVNVVLLGGAPRLLLNRFVWPPEMRIRLWVLSEANKRVLTELLAVDPAHVAVIPRYRLFGRGNNPRVVVKPNRFARTPWHLVLSSRASRGKNFKLSCAVANYLQLNSRQPISVTVCGPKPSLAETEDLVRGFHWRVQPQVRGDLGAQWHLRMGGKPCLIGLSTSYEEDFGVSVAQAQEAGWPLILSEWGAHLDIRAERRIRIPAHLIMSPLKGEASLSAAAERIGRLILTARFNTDGELPPVGLKPSMPTTYAAFERALSSRSPHLISTIVNLFSGRPAAGRGGLFWKRKINRIMSGGTDRDPEARP